MLIKPAPKAKYALDFTDMTKWIEDKYNFDHRNYKNLAGDYWHWLLGNQFYEMHNGSYHYFDILNIINDEDTPDWVKEITQMFHNEFVEYLDKDGCVEVFVWW